jgi:type III pantothenate kinase
MILVIDVGNTNMVLGLYENEQLTYHWRLASNRAQTADEYGMQVLALFRHVDIDVRDISGIIISSVVPPLMFVLEQLCSKYLHHQPMIVNSNLQTGLDLQIDQPAELGADRIVNAVAAIEKYGFPVIIVDFGTATTVCYINELGQYMGGAIAPGIGISTEALYQKAAKLPRVELAVPPRPIAQNTIQAMQAGIIYGFAGQVDGIVERMMSVAPTKPKVVATGGLAEMIAKQSRTIEQIDPFLTLDGLRIIYNRQG